MKKIILTILTVVFITPFANAAEFGLSAGFGVPFVSQYAINATFGSSLSMSLGQNSLEVDVSSSKVSLTMPEVVFNWHPFAGSFYLGLGLGQETLEATATDETTGLSASAEVTASTLIARLGWMWGKGDGGLWFGMDLTYVSPSGADVIVDAGGLSSSDTAFQDVVDAGEQFGETAYTNITFARLGYLF